MRPIFDTHTDLIEEAEACFIWVSGTVHWRRIVLPALFATLGLTFVGMADAATRQGNPSLGWLWWVGIVTIFAPAAATLFATRQSRNEAISVLLIVGLALYGVKLLYAPGMLWGYDESLHYRTIDNLLTTRHLFTPNTLLPVSPFYPGMESVTSALTQITGLSALQAGLVLIGIVRLLAVLAVFLLLERIASPSRLAGPATLIYMSCPAFLYFDSMLSYESLALALSLVTLFVLAQAQLEEGVRRQGLNAIGALLVLAVVVTHHVTSFILAGALVAWTVFQMVWTLWNRRRRPSAGRFDKLTARRRVYLLDLPGSLWVPVLAVGAVAFWLLNVGEIAIAYLTPQLLSGVTEILSMIQQGGRGGRQLFQSSAGHSAPLLERATGIASVLLILVLIPPAIKYLWERRHSSVLSHFLGIGSIAYPAILALRFTQGGWDVGSRATAFVYLPLSFTVAAGIELIVARVVGRKPAWSAVIIAMATVIFAGGIVAGTSPVTRLPAPFNPGTAEVAYDVESRAAANWAATVLGSNHRFVGDTSSNALIGSVGRQNVVTADTKGVSVSALFLSPGFGTSEAKIVRAGKIQYVYVDRRIAGAEPLKGFIYEKWERTILDYGSSVSTETVDKFAALRGANRVFDSGNVQIFGVDRLAR